MTMNEIRDFMEPLVFGFFATTDGSRAAVRPMSGWAWVENELWCATSIDSDKTADVRRTPGVEFCFSDAFGDHVRIEGTCVVSEAADDKKKLLDIRPDLAPHVGGADSPGYGVLRLKPARVRKWRQDDHGYEDIAVQ